MNTLRYWDAVEQARLENQKLARRVKRVERIAKVAKWGMIAAAVAVVYNAASNKES